jgi:hypothetical protein
MGEEFKYIPGQKIQITELNSLLFNGAGEKGTIEQVLPEENAVIAQINGRILKLYPIEFQVIQNV